MIEHIKVVYEFGDRTFTEGETVRLVKPYTAYGKAGRISETLKVGAIGIVDRAKYQLKDRRKDNQLAINWESAGSYYTDVECIDHVEPTEGEIAATIESIKKAL